MVPVRRQVSHWPHPHTAVFGLVLLPSPLKEFRIGLERGCSAFFDRIKFVFITIIITTLPYASLNRHLLLQSEISDRRGLNALLTSFLVLQASNTIPMIQQQRCVAQFTARSTVSPLKEKLLRMHSTDRGGAVGLTQDAHLSRDQVRLLSPVGVLLVANRAWRVGIRTNHVHCGAGHPPTCVNQSVSPSDQSVSCQCLPPVVTPPAGVLHHVGHCGVSVGPGVLVLRLAQRVHPGRLLGGDLRHRQHAHGELPRRRRTVQRYVLCTFDCKSLHQMDRLSLIGCGCH